MYAGIEGEKEPESRAAQPPGPAQRLAAAAAAAAAAEEEEAREGGCTFFGAKKYLFAPPIQMKEAKLYEVNTRFSSIKIDPSAATPKVFTSSLHPDASISADFQ